MRKKGGSHYWLIGAPMQGLLTKFAELILPLQSSRDWPEVCFTLKKRFVHQN
jgi:hypothetical protein